MSSDMRTDTFGFYKLHSQDDDLGRGYAKRHQQFDTVCTSASAKRNVNSCYDTRIRKEPFVKHRNSLIPLAAADELMAVAIVI